MKKYLFILMTCLFTFFAFSTFSVQAFEVNIDDQANLLTASQKKNLQSKIDRYEDKYGIAIGIVTIDNNDKGSSQTYADYYILDHEGKDKDAVLLLIDMDTRKLTISTSGKMIDIFTDEKIDKMLAYMKTQAQKEDYNGVGHTFLNKVSSYTKKGIDDGQYRYDQETGETSQKHRQDEKDNLLAPIGATFSGLLSALGLGGAVRNKYKIKETTYNYDFHENSTMSLRAKDDRLVDTFITTRKIERPSSSDSNTEPGRSTTHKTGGGTFGGGSTDF